ncbi:MAG: hypothetical protein ACRDX8_04280 [Acidimicrobiales bacterium]
MTQRAAGPPNSGSTGASGSGSDWAARISLDRIDRAIQFRLLRDDRTSVRGIADDVGGRRVRWRSASADLSVVA